MYFLRFVDEGLHILLEDHEHYLLSLFHYSYNNPYFLLPYSRKYIIDLMIYYLGHMTVDSYHSNIFFNYIFWHL